jgi:hypothetical protein
VENQNGESLQIRTNELGRTPRSQFRATVSGANVIKPKTIVNTSKKPKPAFVLLKDLLVR